MHSLKISKENVAKFEEVTLSFRSRSQVFTKSTGSRHTARQTEKEVYLVIVQSREDQQSLLDKKQLFADVSQKTTSFEHEAQTARYLTHRSGMLWTVYELAIIQEKTCDPPD